MIPFGLTTGPKVCQIVFKPLLVKWRRDGIISLIFYDDGIFGCESYNSCKIASDLIYSDLIKANVLPNPKKSQWEPVKSIEWLGFEWDMENGGVKVTEKRLEKFFERIQIVKNIYPFVTPRSIARIVGSLISMHLVIGDVCMLRTRYLQNIVNYKHVMEVGWDRRVNVNHIDVGPLIVDEIKWLEQNIPILNFRSFFPEIKARRILYGDASDFAVGGYLLDGTAKKPFNSDLPDSLVEKSSGERELFAIKCAILTFGEELNGSSVLYKTDSKVAETVCRKGSPKLYLHKYIVDILDLCKRFDIQLCVVWISRDLNEIADYYSKASDTDSWTTRSRFFEKIKTLSGLNFSLDAFANVENTKVPRFYSKHHCPSSLGIDALAHSWQGEAVWACPPVKLLVQTFFHMKNCKAKGVVILPEWISLPVWPLFRSPSFAPFIRGIWSFPGYLYLKSNDKNCIFNENFRGAIRVCKFDFSC